MVHNIFAQNCFTPQIDPKRAIPRQENVKTAKCFVGGIPQSATSESFKAFFSQFGPLLDSTLMLDRDTQKPRGYGFVTYENDQVVEQLIQMDNLAMDGKMIEVKRAAPRNADGTRRQTGPQKPEMNQKRSGGDFGNDGNSGMFGYGSNSMGGGNDMSSMMMGNNTMASMMMNPMFNSAGSQSFDPNAMASFFQQQGGGGAFNPMMFQQMMMAANMGGMMGGSGGGWSNNGNMGGFGMGMGGNGGSMANNGNRKTGGRSGSADQGSNHDQDRNSRDRSEPNRGRPLNAPPSSAGLPTRPDGSNNNSSRDYQRERSPGRREDSSGAREGRW